MPAVLVRGLAVDRAAAACREALVRAAEEDLFR